MSSCLGAVASGGTRIMYRERPTPSRWAATSWVCSLNPLSSPVLLVAVELLAFESGVPFGGV